MTPIGVQEPLSHRRLKVLTLLAEAPNGQLLSPVLTASAFFTWGNGDKKRVCKAEVGNQGADRISRLSI